MAVQFSPQARAACYIVTSTAVGLGTSFFTAVVIDGKKDDPLLWKQLLLGTGSALASSLIIVSCKTSSCTRNLINKIRAACRPPKAGETSIPYEIGKFFSPCVPGCLSSAFKKYAPIQAPNILNIFNNNILTNNPLSWDIWKGGLTSFVGSAMGAAMQNTCCRGRCREPDDPLEVRAPDTDEKSTARPENPSNEPDATLLAPNDIPSDKLEST